MPKSYRIRTQVGVDKYINVKLDQDFDFLVDPIFKNKSIRPLYKGVF